MFQRRSRRVERARHVESFMPTDVFSTDDFGFHDRCEGKRQNIAKQHPCNDLPMIDKAPFVVVLSHMATQKDNKIC